MALEKEEYLWRMVNEHMSQARHQETLRASMTTFLITLSGAIVGLITFDKRALANRYGAFFSFVIFRCLWSIFLGQTLRKI